jgi:hypothetical protein
MTPADELLAMRVGEERARFWGDLVNLAFKEAHAEAGPPNKANIEAALRQQIGHGNRLLYMAQSACRDLAEYVKLPPVFHKVLMEALAEAVKHFRELREMVADWTRRQGVSLAGAEDLDPLISGLDDSRAVLFAARHSVFPGLEPDRVSQAIRDVDAGRGRPLDDVLAELAEPAE